MGHSSSPGRDLLVAIAGPLTHVPQVLIWVAILALSAHAVHYPWQHNLDIPDIRTHFWLAVCAGAAQVRYPTPGRYTTLVSIPFRACAPHSIKQWHQAAHLLAKPFQGQQNGD